MRWYSGLDFKLILNMRVGEILENSVSVKKTAVFDDSYIDFFVDHTDQFKTHMCSRHYHSLNEIYYYLGNKMKYIVGNKSYVISKMTFC